MKIKIDELRNMAPEELVVKLSACKEELGKLQYLKTVGQADKPHRFKELRRTIARIQTVLNENPEGGKAPGARPAGKKKDNKGRT
ncbi:MAG: 50S ribosomal protein L29 [Deltaproteobacteria bacterium]